jgi:glycosyltransferase involved in cell wall biosynthesis
MLYYPWVRLSFVVPAYNEEAYLPACLESILAQTRELGDAVEVIVVNNASTDRTREVALAIPGVRVVDEPQKGLTFARQAGFLASSGELIANVDSDGRLPPGWVAQVLDAFAQNPKLVCLSGPLVYYDLSRIQRLGVTMFYWLAKTLYALNRYVLHKGSMVQGGNFILRRDALEKIGGFNTAIAFYGEDTDIARRIYPMGDVDFTLKFKIFTSGRRLRHEGVLTMGGRYTINYIWTLFGSKPYSEKYLDIREGADGKLSSEEK